jgi:ferredoxin
VACKIAEFELDEVKYIELAESAGIGQTRYEIVGEPIENMQRKFKPPHTYSNKFFRFMIGKVIFKHIFPVLEKISKIKINPKKCIYCGMCEKACPIHAISIDKINKTNHIDHNSCIGCMCCHEVCPNGAPYLSKAFFRTFQRKMWGAKLGKSGLAEFE